MKVTRACSNLSNRGCCLHLGLVFRLNSESLEGSLNYFCSVRSLPSNQLPMHIRKLLHHTLWIHGELLVCECLKKGPGECQGEGKEMP